MTSAADFAEQVARIARHSPTRFDGPLPLSSAQPTPVSQYQASEALRIARHAAKFHLDKRVRRRRQEITSWREARRTLRVEVSAAAATYSIDNGKPLELLHYGQPVKVSEDQRQPVPSPTWHYWAPDRLNRPGELLTAATQPGCDHSARRGATFTIHRGWPRAHIEAACRCPGRPSQ